MSGNEPRSEGPLKSSIEKLRHEIDNWFEAALVQGEKALGAVGLRGGEFAWVPRVDVTETDNEVLVFLEVPGVDPELVDVTLAGNMLTVRGEKLATPRDERTVAHAIERSAGRFCRAIPLPVPVNADQVSAEAKEGVLTIRMFKAERARARQIRVQSGTHHGGPGPG
ncbi:MAG: Hsp20/alpha crystallin family protein [Planctomycetales bacterium]